LLETYDGDVERALCAYNAGARRMKEISDAEGGWERWRDARERAGNSGILAYAHRVLHYRDELRGRGYFPEFYAPDEEALAESASALQSAPPLGAVPEASPSGAAAR